MIYDICPFCNKPLFHREEGRFAIVNGSCFDCKADFSFIRHDNSPGVWFINCTAIYTVINNAYYSVRIYNDNSIIYAYKQFKIIELMTFNKKLLITPSNINRKIQMYLSLI